ncbi:MAG: hypothetical protein HY657_18065 [Acidobacteria bacterium]|nr:hypothetical protein [Acidobacteriota bacterium]
MNLVRSLIAVIGGVALVSLVVEPLEFTLVNAVADASIEDMAGYFAVRNRPGILAAKLVYNSLAAVLGGYMAAKIAGTREMAHASAAALLQTAALIWGFTLSEYAPFTPAWTRVALVVLTGPAMLAGGMIRAKAASGASTGGTS